MLLRQPINRVASTKDPRRVVTAWLFVVIVCLVNRPGSSSAAPLSLEVSVHRAERASSCADRFRMQTKVEQLSQRGATQAQRLSQAPASTLTAPAPVSSAPQASQASQPPASTLTASAPVSSALASQPPASAKASSDQLRVMVLFDRIGDDYLADVRFSGAKPGERRLRDRGPDCTSLEEAVAVTIVLLLDSEHQSRERTPPLRLHAVSTIKMSKGKVDPLPRVARSSEWTLGAKGGLLWGASDTTSSWLALSAGISFAQRWQLELGALTLLPNTQSYGQGVITVSMNAAEVRGCRLFGDSLLFGICVVPTLGRLHGSGRGFDHDVRSNLLWAALGASVSARMQLNRHWFVGLEATSWWPLEDQTFSVENLGAGWNSSAIWGALAARLGVRFR